MSRRQIVRDFFELRRQLNQGNKVANIRSELSFLIQSEGPELLLFAVCASDAETHRICLGERSKNRRWERGGLTTFVALESFCADQLNELDKITFGGKAPLILAEEYRILLEHELLYTLKGLLQRFNYRP